MIAVAHLALTIGGIGTFGMILLKSIAAVRQDNDIDDAGGIIGSVGIALLLVGFFVLYNAA